MAIGFDAIGMAGISEEPENRFPLAGRAELTLDWQVRLFAATEEYISRPGDTPADQAFLGTLEKAFRLDRSIVGRHIGEELAIGLGEVRLSNTDGAYDFLSVDHTPLGQRIEIRMGDPKRPYSEWYVVLNGFMTDHQVDREAVVFRLRDAGHLLDVPVSPNVYAGTGGTEGGADLAGKRKPRGFGWVREATPPLVIPSSLAYQLNDGPIHAVQNVYVRGVALTPTGDHATVAAMNAASLSVGQYATSLATGWIRVAVANDAEASRVTCDFAGDKTGAVFAETTADIVRRMIATATEVVDPDEISEATFDRLNDEQPAPVGYYIAEGEEQTAAQAVSALMKNIGGWCGPNRRGRFEVRRFTAPSGIPVARFTKDNLEDVGTVPLPNDLSPPPYRVLVGYERNWTVQTSDLAGSITEDRVAFLKEQLRYGSFEDSEIALNFPPGHELVREGGYFKNKADAEAEAERQLALWPGRAIYSLKLSEKLFIFEPGQVIHVAFKDRFGLTAGKLLRIVKDINDSEEGVELWGFG